MGIQYDPTKPAANDKPTNDQPVMQTNFASIKQLIDIDHTDFSNAAFGTHLKVTFGSNNIPPGPTFTPPVLFTKDTPSQLFFYTGTQAQSSNQYYTNFNAASSVQSSVLLMGGIIMKWGIINFSGSQNPGTTFTGPSGLSPFPNAGLNLQISLTNTAGAVPIAWRITTFDLNGFSSNVQATGNSNLYWLAIGN